jgi:hypothetical protein
MIGIRILSRLLRTLSYKVQPTPEVNHDIIQNNSLFDRSADIVRDGFLNGAEDVSPSLCF